jgi:dTDP-glucose pyrophosphorylase
MRYDELATINNFQEWQKCVLQGTDTIKTALKNLDSTGTRIIVIVDKEDNYLGIVTEGDIRRQILKGVKLNQPLLDFINKNAIFLYEGQNVNQIINKLIELGIDRVPVLNRYNKICDILFVDLKSQKHVLKNEFVIMAGGKGLRLRPLTENLPKPMLKLSGKPILEHIINDARSMGFINITISINYLGNMIKDYFEKGESLGVNISYIEEPKELGTAGSIGLLSPNLTWPIVIANGDIIGDVSYSEMLKYHISQKCCATMAVKKFTMQNPYGVVDLNNNEIEQIIEKPNYQSYINAGMYILSKDAMLEIPNNQYLDMPDLFSNLIKQKKQTVAYKVEEKWLDIGQMKDWEKAKEIFNGI